MEYREYPDHLKKPVPTSDPQPDDLEDLLAGELLLDDGQPSEPVLLAYRAMRRLARQGIFGPGVPGPRVWPAVAPPDPIRLRDPLRLSGTAAGSAATRTWGVQEALKPGGVRLLCITGPAGVGKTRLATDVAEECHQRIVQANQASVSPRLTVGLRSTQSGAGKRRLGLTPYDALMDLLLALGVAEHEIPATLAARRVRYVTALTGRRPVILIDDAADGNQVVPLLPPEQGVVVVTSRDRSRGLPEGAVYTPVPVLDASGTGALVRRCFQEFGSPVDEAAAAAIHAWCEGTPLPVILISRWMATARGRQASAQELMALLETARCDGPPDHAAPAAPRGRAGTPAVAAMLSLLSEDQQAATRMFGLLRLPEADLSVVCVAAGLTPQRARAALRRLTEIGLLTRDDPGRVWAMPPAIADYAAAWARADEQAMDIYQRMLSPLIGLYERRVRSLLDTRAEDGMAEWAAAEILAAREVLASLLDAAAVGADPARAGRLAADCLEAIGHLDEREIGWRETDRFVAPVLAVAGAAGDARLKARAIERFGRDAARQDHGKVAPAPIPHEPEPEPEAEEDAEAGAKAGPAGTRIGLDLVATAVGPDVAGPARPVLFGAGA